MINRFTIDALAQTKLGLLDQQKNSFSYSKD